MVLSASVSGAARPTLPTETTILLTKNWCDHTWQAIAVRAHRFRAALAREKLETGDRVAILLPNGVEWVCLTWRRMRLA